MPSGGYFKAWRAMLQSDLWKRKERERLTTREVRMYLQAKANYAPANVEIGRRTVHVPTDGVLTSYKKLQKDWGWSSKTIRGFLRREARANRLTLFSKRGKEDGYTLITLRDIWGLDADSNGEKWLNDEWGANPDSLFDSPFSPHKQEEERIIVGREDQYVRESDHLSEGFPEGIGSTECGAASAAIENQSYLEFVETLPQKPANLTQLNAIRKLTPGQRRQLKADIEAGQPLAVAIVKALSKSNNSGAQPAERI